MKKTMQFFGFSLFLFLAFAFTPATTEAPSTTTIAAEMPPLCNGAVKVNVPMSYTGTVGVRIINSSGVPVFSMPLSPGGGVFVVYPELPIGDTYEVCVGATTPVAVSVKYSFCGESSAEPFFPIPTAGTAYCMPDIVDLT